MRTSAGPFRRNRLPTSTFGLMPGRTRGGQSVEPVPHVARLGHRHSFYVAVLVTVREMAAAHPHVELARRMVLTQDPDDHAAPAARAKFSRARPHQRRAVTVPLMRGEDVDRVDLAGMRVVADARRAAV